MTRSFLPIQLSMLVLLLVLLGVSCSGDRGRHGVDGVVPASDAISNSEARGGLPGSGLPELSELDLLQVAVNSTDPEITHSTSGITKNSLVDGNLAIANSSHVILAPEGYASMAAGPGEVDWAIYRAFNYGVTCSHFSLDLTILSKNCYVALPDFASGRWILNGPYAAGEIPSQFSILDENFVSARGNQYFAVLVADGAQVRLDAYTSYTVVPDANSHVVATNAALGAAALDMDGIPGIAFAADSGVLRLSFASAKGDSPQQASDWFLSEIDAVNEPNFIDAVNHDGVPVVVYSTSGGELWLAQAKLPRPKLDTDWETVNLVNDRECRGLSIMSEGQKLHIAVFENDPLDLDADFIFGYLYYLRSDSTDVLGGFSAYRIGIMGDTTGVSPTEPALAMIDGTPAIAICNRGLTEGARIQFSHATLTEPGPADWGSHLIDNPAVITGIGLGEVLGRPVIFWNGTFPSLYLGKTSRPAETLDWSYKTILLDSSDSRLDFLVHNDHPILAYCHTGIDPHPNYIYMFEPLLAAGNPNLNMDNLVIIQAAPVDAGLDPSLARIAGKPVYVWCDQSGYTLNYAPLI
ncbi:MAG: hypothetical protein R3F46_14245 [bacterium]